MVWFIKKSVLLQYNFYNIFLSIHKLSVFMVTLQFALSRQTGTCQCNLYTSISVNLRESCESRINISANLFTRSTVHNYRVDFCDCAIKTLYLCRRKSEYLKLIVKLRYNNSPFEIWAFVLTFQETPVDRSNFPTGDKKL